MVPDYIKKQEEELKALMDGDDDPCITIKEAAKFLKMDTNSLLTSIANNTCPFAVGGRHGTRGKRFGKIPKVTFYNWITKGIVNTDEDI